MADTYTLLEKITVGAAGASSVTFTSIPQTFTDLKVVVSGRTDRAAVADGVYISINSSTSTFSNKYLEGNGATASSASDARFVGVANGNTSTASTFSNFEIYFPNYTGSTNKSFSIDSVMENNASTGYVDLAAGLWSTTSAITSITLTPGTGNFAQYSTFYLYGIAKEGVSPAPSSAPYATGGDSIVFDGTYWIHTFRSSGTFTPKKSLSCDYLVVAGGAGGGYFGGGGGAGGLRSTVTATGGGGSLESALSVVANTAYTVTVGAGGAGSTVSGTAGTSGSNSVFSSITSTGGGGGGAFDNNNAATGGSGGGGAPSTTSKTGGSGTANQGYAGGNNNPITPNYPGGGGGGAGAVGQTPSTGSTGGNGGAGTATSISGSSVTYAGGGGGGTNGGTAGTGSAGGGNGTTGGSAGTAATANTGSGGGGGGLSQNGGAGGSGIVIVRYAA